jgi:hypothetical protein
MEASLVLSVSQIVTLPGFPKLLAPVANLPLDGVEGVLEGSLSCGPFAVGHNRLRSHVDHDGGFITAGTLASPDALHRDGGAQHILVTA